MKHLKKLTAVLLIVMIVFTSCSKENEVKEQDYLYKIEGKTTYHVYDNFDGTHTIKNNDSYNEIISEANSKLIRDLLKNTTHKLLQIPIYHGSGTGGNWFYPFQTCYLSYLDLNTNTQTHPVQIDCCDVPGMLGYWNPDDMDVDDGIFSECP